jgi:hypothetical protein
MKTGLQLADHGPANGQEKRSGFAESMAATFDEAGPCTVPPELARVFFGQLGSDHDPIPRGSDRHLATIFSFTSYFDARR